MTGMCSATTVGGGREVLSGAGKENRRLPVPAFRLSSRRLCDLVKQRDVPPGIARDRRSRDLEMRVDFGRDVEWQHAGADGEAGMATGVAEYRDEQVRGTVQHLGLLEEVGR